MLERDSPIQQPWPWLPDQLDFRDLSIDFDAETDGQMLCTASGARNHMGTTGDMGTDCRLTMAGLALFGVPPEKYWPYVIPDFEKEPTAFVYSLAQNYKGLVYLKLDLPGMTPTALLQKIKISIANGWPVMFGFTLYQSYTQAMVTGEIPYPVTQQMCCPRYIEV